MSNSLDDRIKAAEARRYRVAGWVVDINADPKATPAQRRRMAATYDEVCEDLHRLERLKEKP